MTLLKFLARLGSSLAGRAVRSSGWRHSNLRFHFLPISLPDIARACARSSWGDHGRDSCARCLPQSSSVCSSSGVSVWRACDAFSKLVLMAALCPVRECIFSNLRGITSKVKHRKEQLKTYSSSLHSLPQPLEFSTRHRSQCSI